MLSYSSCTNIEEGLEMVQSFRGLLEKEMQDLKQKEQEEQPLPMNLRNRIMIKLAHLRNAARKLRQQLHGVRQYVDKSRLQAQLAGFVSREIRDRQVGTVSVGKTKPCDTSGRGGENKENQGTNDSKKPENRTNEDLKRMRRHTSEAYIPVVHSKLETRDAPKQEAPKPQPAVSILPVIPSETKIEDSSSTLRDLRSNIYKELEELRCIEQRERIVRNLNDSRHRSISEAKKRHDPTPLPESKHTKSVIQYEERKIAKVASNLTFETELSDIESITKDLRSQDITVTVDVKTRSPTQVSLLCPNNHEYYVGSTIGKTPHGHGRFYNCCASVPLTVPEGVQFYTGGFCKGRFEGYGTLTTKEGVKFVGNFRDGLKHGEGSLFYRGKVEIARWANDKFVSNI